MTPMRFAIAALVVLSAAAFAPASEELEALLLHKFGVQNKLETERLRVAVTEAVTKAKELKDIDPDQGIEILRLAVHRIDTVKLLNPSDRRSLLDFIQPLVQELRDASLLKRRELASRRLDAFKDYLEVTALEGRFPGRSGVEKWEPASFMASDGQSRVGKLFALSDRAVTHKFGIKELNVVPLVLPVIQVFGGFYVYDRPTGYHIFLSNREFHAKVWAPLIAEFETADVPGKRRLTATELARTGDKVRWQAEIDTGEYFLRALPDLEPIPGVGANEDPFLAFLALSLMSNGLPTPVDRIYSKELRDSLVGFAPIKMSAARRTLRLLEAKGARVSPLYTEIMRDETSKLLKSEFAGFSETEANRAVFYVFSKLK
jgi:hypothetical protein